MPRLDGYDAAHYQYDHSDVDFNAGLLAGLWWIAWKATQSIKYVDPTFAKARSKWAGFRMRGMYHWLSSTTDVAAQAAHYLDTVGIWSVGEFAMLDAEEKGITPAMCLRWCELVESVTHRPCVIYTGLYVSGGSIWKSDALRMSRYGPRPFIVAAYVTEANLKTRMTTLGCFPDYDRDAWQFSSNGPVPGVEGRCDMDQVDNVAAFELACAISHIPVPLPGDDDMLRLLAPNDSPARFYAMVDSVGRACRCEWTGDGTDPAVDARLEFYANAHPKGGVPFELVMDVAGLINVSLDGPLPPGFRAEQFGNPDEINARAAAGGTVDTAARAQIVALNDSVGRLGQRQSSAGAELVKAGNELQGS